MRLFFISDYLRRRDERLKEAARIEKIKNAENLFQLREYQGELWLTYDDCLVCPCSMIKEEPVEAVRQMRELYLER